MSKTSSFTGPARVRRGGLLSTEDASAAEPHVVLADAARMQAPRGLLSADNVMPAATEQPMPVAPGQPGAGSPVGPQAAGSVDIVQNAVNRFISANPDKPMAALQPGELKRLIDAPLPAGSAGPTLAEVQQILAQLRSGPGTGGLLGTR